MLDFVQHTFNKPLTIGGVIVTSCAVVEDAKSVGVFPCDQYGRERGDIAFTDSSAIRLYKTLKNIYKDS